MTNYTRLVSELKDCSNWLSDREDVHDILLLAADAIEELNSESKPKWISVDEALPESGIFVIAKFDDGKVENVWQRWSENDFLIYPVISGYYYTHKVTHWMPMPA